MTFVAHRSDWERECARDLRALGSPIFYALVIVRIAIDRNVPYLSQLLIAGGVLLIMAFLSKSADLTIARALVLAILTSLFYSDLLYSAFVTVLFLILLYVSTTLGVPQRSLWEGVLIGAVSVGVGYSAHLPL